MNPAPVIVELRTGKALLIGIMAAFCALVLLGFGALFAATGRMEGQIIFLGGCVILAIGGCAVYYIGLAIRKPVALRMDAKGISGYYAEPAIWPEIMEIASFEGSKGARYLGIAFLNPETIRNRQSAWSKFTNWSSNPFGYRYQIVISQELLKDADVEALAAVARTFHRAA